MHAFDPPKSSSPPSPGSITPRSTTWHRRPSSTSTRGSSVSQKMGGEYRPTVIGARRWERLATSVGLDAERVVDEVCEMARRLPDELARWSRARTSPLTTPGSRRGSSTGSPSVRQLCRRSVDLTQLDRLVACDDPLQTLARRRGVVEPPVRGSFSPRRRDRRGVPGAASRRRGRPARARGRGRGARACGQRSSPGSRRRPTRRGTRPGG